MALQKSVTRLALDSRRTQGGATYPLSAHGAVACGFLGLLLSDRIYLWPIPRSVIAAVAIPFIASGIVNSRREGGPVGPPIPAVA